MTEYEACYVFRPHQTEISLQVSQRPNKRRKANKHIIPSGSNESLPFLPLFSGTEKSESVHLRLTLFRDAWKYQENDTLKLFLAANSEAILEIVSFVQAADAVSTTRKLPCGLVVAGPSFATHCDLFESVKSRLNREQKVSTITLDSSQSPNLKSALKYINRTATSQDPELVDDDAITPYSKDSRYLNYDLQILYDYVQEHSITKVVLSFPDSEAFNNGFFAELIDVLSSWNDRIPFVLLFGIATSVDMFQEKLPRATIRNLHGVRFDVAQLNIEDIFKKASCPDDSRCLWLGSDLSKTIVQRHKLYIQSVSSFIRTLKYIYMSHFFANPLSAFLEQDVSFLRLQPEHYESIRNLASFQKIAEAFVDQGDHMTARKLLDDDSFLHEIIACKLKENQEKLRHVIQATEVIFETQSHISSKADTPWSELYISAMSGELRDSTLSKDILLSVRKMPSDAMKELLTRLSHFPIPHMAQIAHDLRNLVSKSGNTTTPLRSEHDSHHQTLRTTVVAQKVELSKNTSALSQQDLAYSKIVNRVSDLLKTFFDTSLINPQELFLHEIFIYDLKSPNRDAFAPKPRLAVERALSSPHDYLGCDCCAGLDSALSATQPATTVLYQLHVESGAVINVADLWSAFYSIMGKEDCEDEEADQQSVLALFSRGLAELKYIGMIRSSRKKADHLTKLLWKGL